MKDTEIKVNGKCVGEYDMCPDDNTFIGVFGTTIDTSQLEESTDDNAYPNTLNFRNMSSDKFIALRNEYMDRQYMCRPSFIVIGTSLACIGASIQAINARWTEPEFCYYLASNDEGGLVQNRMTFSRTLNGAKLWVYDLVIEQDINNPEKIVGKIAKICLASGYVKNGSSIS